MADKNKVSVINMGDPVEHMVWANTPEHLRHGRYNKETNTTMYYVKAEDCTQEDIDAFLEDYPDFEAIP